MTDLCVHQLSGWCFSLFPLMWFQELSFPLGWTLLPMKKVGGSRSSWVLLSWGESTGWETARCSGGDPGDQETCSTWLELGEEQTWEPMSPWPTASQFAVFNLLLLIPAEQGKP